MRAVPQSHSSPEIVVRKVLHALGLRFRLHRRDLPGTPDIGLTKHRTVIFVHGCFWHRHPNCKRTTVPKTRAKFWSKKFARNVERDAHNEARLLKGGWRVLIVWECETSDVSNLRNRLLSYFPRIRGAPPARDSKTQKS